MQQTFIKSIGKQSPKWFIIDANDQILGRLATKVSLTLMGKNKKTYIPFLENGNKVIIINADKIRVTGRKNVQKKYYRHSGRPGGMKIEKFNSLIERRPEKIIESAIRGMLPKNKLGRIYFKNLTVCKGDDHKYASQKPIFL